MAEERVQKIVARAGLASRRKAEEWIAAGRVKVNGRVVRELGAKANPRRDRIEVDGRRVAAEDLLYVVFHKPRGVVSTMEDPRGRDTVAGLVRRVPARVVPVGRLDYHTSGVLLMTNDGDFAQAMLHPKRAVPKLYVAKLRGHLEDEQLERLRQPVEIDGQRTRAAAVQRLRFEADKTWVRITLHEGRNRQVRRLAEAAGFPVLRLVRESFAGITAEDVRPGQWRYLSVDEQKELKRAWGVPARVRPPPALPVESRRKRR